MKYQNKNTGVIVSVRDDKAMPDVWAKVGGEHIPKPEKSETPDGTWKVTDLKAYAETHSIDLGDATKKDDIIAAINAE